MSNDRIPSHWRRTTLGKVATYINGKAFKPSEWNTSGLPIIRIQNLNRENSEFNYCNFAVDAKYYVNTGDLLFAWSGTPDTSFGAHIWKGERAVLNQHIFRIVVDESVILKSFYLHALNNKVKEFVKASHGTAGLAHITKRKFEAAEIFLPPLDEQQRIVLKLEELLSQLGHGVQQLKTSERQLISYRQAVLKYAFEGKLTNKGSRDKLPSRWRWCTIGDICSSVEYGSASKSKESGKVPVLRMGNIQGGTFDWSDLVYTDDEYEIEKYSLRRDDVLFNRTNSSELVGKTAIYKGERPAIFAGYLIRINRIESLVNPNYLTYFLNSHLAKRYGDSVKTFGVNQSNINGSKLKTYPIPLAPLEEQHLIVQEIESRFSVCDKLQEVISRDLKKTEILRRRILNLALEGSLSSETKLKTKKGNFEKNPTSHVYSEISSNRLSNHTVNQEAPKATADINPTDIHAGILAMMIDEHEKSPEHHFKLTHVKGEKIAHLVESHIGIDLGRNPRKDAAGPDDFPHLKKVESRAEKAGWFSVKKLRVGQTYVSKSGMAKIINRLKAALPSVDISKIEKLIQTFLPFELEHAEVVATLYAAWNNLLLEEKNPTDEEIVYEARENWSKRKLSIERKAFFKALAWMKGHGFVPEGKGKKVI